ncbi:hypothetical protein Patl1_34925 [Pistacia atlantica]|uniref:Uncharacterized protein n=1 Tax=Pistacia atlantica TaxID=434234 RepID=A0ACC0ZSG2_9ROSI|nr:hypothetical protein Patl1_34925 [Pistacia atlantica]
MLIYSSENRGWQLSGSTFLGPFTLTAMGGVFWNVAIHWINDGHKSLYLNVEEEKVGEMPMPPFPDGFPHRNYSRWFIKYQVDLCGVATAFPETLHSDFNQHYSRIADETL